MKLACLLFGHKETYVHKGEVEFDQKKNKPPLRLKGNWKVFWCLRKGCDYERLEPA